MNLNQLEKKRQYRMRRRVFNEAKTEALQQMIHTVNRGLSMQMEMVMLMVLHDKFGFGAERCTKALVAFETLWGDVGNQHLSLDDIEEVVKNEIGLMIEKETVYQLDSKGNKKVIWTNEN